MTLNTKITLYVCECGHPRANRIGQCPECKTTTFRLVTYLPESLLSELAEECERRKAVSAKWLAMGQDPRETPPVVAAIEELDWAADLIRKARDGCPCGCDVPITDDRYAELHGDTPPVSTEDQMEAEGCDPTPPN